MYGMVGGSNVCVTTIYLCLENFKTLLTFAPEMFCLAHDRMALNRIELNFE